ncbi:hypothetical protein L1887_47768 [Cichorium endivia]|nr:hypothetical protein L1887_47768 [Cichorium endivia]
MRLPGQILVQRRWGQRQRTARLVEETEAHVVVGLLLLLLLLLGGGGGGARVGSGSDGGSGGESLGVGEVLLGLLGALELEVGGERDGDEVLVAVDERVHDRGDGGVVERERDAGDLLDTQHKAVHQLVLGDVEDARLEALALVVDLHDRHTVREGRDVEHVEQRSLRGADTVAGIDDLDVRDDLDGTTGDLGGDTEGLEERGLTGLHTGVTGLDEDVLGSVGTSTGGGGNTVGQDEVTNILEVTRGEDETDVALEVGQQTLVVGVVTHEHAQSTTGHGVLAHQHNTLAAERLTDLVHLLRADIVDVDDEDRGVLLEQLGELVEPSLLGSTRHSTHFGCRTTIDRVMVEKAKRAGRERLSWPNSRLCRIATAAASPRRAKRKIFGSVISEIPSCLVRVVGGKYPDFREVGSSLLAAKPGQVVDLRPQQPPDNRAVMALQL